SLQIEAMRAQAAKQESQCNGDQFRFAARVARVAGVSGDGGGLAGSGHRMESVAGSRSHIVRLHPADSAAVRMARRRGWGSTPVRKYAFRCTARWSAAT